MAEFVIFTLAAPMGAFADLAGHERRHSGSWPARSAVLGLVGAALGVRRDEAAGQEKLSRWRTAVSVLSRGGGFRDFHTVQTVPTARIKRPATRRDALKALASGDYPLITWRDYRSDCAFGVALWGGEDPEEVRKALSRPHFTLYLGRKSCPLPAVRPDGAESDPGRNPARGAGSHRTASISGRRTGSGTPVDGGFGGTPGWG